MMNDIMATLNKSNTGGRVIPYVTHQEKDNQKSQSSSNYRSLGWEL